MVAGALLAALLCVLPGCQSDRDQHSSDEWAELEKDRDKLKSQCDKLQTEGEAERAAAKDIHETTVRLAQDEAERFGKQLDAIRDSVAKAMLDAGHDPGVARDDRTAVGKLVSEFVRADTTLRKQKGDLQTRYDALSKVVAGSGSASSSQPDSSPPPSNTTP